MPHPGQLYADLSQYYDHFCHNINYREQCEYAQRVFKSFNSSGGMDYFDLACGTGQHLQYFAEAGFTVTGLDNSQAMLDQAARRCPQAQLMLADLAEFEQRTQFDLISCFLYSLHYSQPLNRLQQVLTRAYTALKSGGVLIFDMVDKSGIINHTGITTYLAATDGQFEFSSAWHYGGEGESMELLLSIKRENDSASQYWNDRHKMSALNIKDIQSYLTALGFEVYIMERNYERLVEWDGSSFNLIVVAVKI